METKSWTIWYKHPEHKEPGVVAVINNVPLDKTPGTIADYFCKRNPSYGRSCITPVPITSIEWNDNQ